MIRCIYRGFIGLFDAIGFIILYVIYVAVVIIQDKLLPEVIVTDDETVSEISFDASVIVRNRLRALSNLSHASNTRSRANTGVENSAYLHPDYRLNSQRPSKTDNDLDARSQDSEHLSSKVYTWKSEAKSAFLPWDPTEFSSGSLTDKAVAILMSPLLFLLKVTCPVVDRENLDQSWNKPLALSQAAFLPWLWYVLLKQYNQPDFGAFPRYACAIIGSVCLPTIIWLTSSLQKPPIYYRFFVYIAFFNCILWIFAEANEVVGLLTALGIMWGVPQAIMGLTFLAWANSVGDLVADVSLARVGQAQTAIAACFGTPLLNLLVGTGIGCTIGILTTPGREDGIHLFVSSNIAID